MKIDIVSVFPEYFEVMNLSLMGKAQAFYCEAGQVVQTYETTLHYTPCAVGDTFFTACFLPRGTGDALPDGPKGILKKRNKWFVAHPENTAKVAAGDYPGLLGAMREIK